MSIEYPPPLSPEGAATKPTPYPAGSAEDQPDTKDVAKEQAANVGQGAAEAGQHVAGVAKEQAGQVTAEAGRQAKELVGQAQSQLKEQAGVQQENLVAGLKSLSAELKSMSVSADKPGPASDVARQASERTGAMAGWLDGKEPAAILDEVTAFARQRPGMFLAFAAGAGLLAGRLTRGLKAQSDNATPDPVDSPSISAPSPTPAYAPPSAPAVPALPPVGVTDPLDPPPAGMFKTPGYLGEVPR